MMNKAVFLDRDGVINLDKGYVYRWEDFEFLPGAVDAMRRFSQAGYALIIVSNQSGIARGYYSESQYQELTSRIEDYLAQRGVHLTGVYHCPHHVDGVIKKLSIHCECRKPAPGMLLQAMRDHDLDMAQSILVGDKSSDTKAAQAAGVGTCFLVAKDIDFEKQSQQVNGIVTSLIACADELGIAW
jgi:D-glycero-D-manno-heptose 1,7-bisphosphate phosphatase